MSTIYQSLTILQGSKVVLGTYRVRMALCAFWRDLYSGRLLWCPLSDISELRVVPCVCGLHDRSVPHTGLAPRYTRRSQDKTNRSLD